MPKTIAFFKQKLSQSTFIRNVTILAGGTAVAQAIVVLVSPLLTRLYTPNDFGILVVYTSLLSIFVVVASLCYELAIMLPDEEDAAANLLVASIFIVFIMSVFFSIALWLLTNQILIWTNAQVIKPFLWLLPFSFFGAGIYQVLNYWAIRKKAFQSIAKTKLSQSIGQVTIQVGLGLLNVGSFGLLLGDVVGRISGSGTLISLAYKQNKKLLPKITYNNICHVLKRYRKFPIFSTWSVLLNSTGLQIAPLLLAAFYGTQVAGWFGLGLRIFGFPMLLLGQAVAQVYIGTASRLAQENPKALKNLFQKTMNRLLVIGIIPCLVIILSGPYLFALIFGKSWTTTGHYMQLLALMFLAQFTIVPLSQTLNILEKQGLQLCWDIGRLILVVISFYFAKLFGWSAEIAIGLYGGCMFFAYSALFLLSHHVLSKIGRNN